MVFNANKVRIGGKTYEVPLDKWFDVEYKIPIKEGAQNKISFKFSDGAKTLSEGEVPYKPEKSPTVLNWLAFQMHEAKACHADIADIKIVEEK